MLAPNRDMLPDEGDVGASVSLKQATGERPQSGRAEQQLRAKLYLPDLPASTASLSNSLSAGTCFLFDRNHFWKDSI